MDKFRNLYSGFNDALRRRIIQFRYEDHAKSEGTPIFTEESLEHITDPLAVVLRKIFIAMRVTDESFNESHRAWGQVEGFMPRDINTHRNNLKKTMLRSRISMGQFLRIVGHVLNLRLLRIDFHLQNKQTGEVSVFSYEDRPPGQ